MPDLSIFYKEVLAQAKTVISTETDNFGHTEQLDKTVW